MGAKLTTSHEMPEGATKLAAAVPPPEESATLAKRLAWFQDLKFGMMIHWGPYSQKGCIESWPLSEQDAWARPGWQGNIDEFKEEYWALNKTFNPVDFDPRAWADIAAQAGMKYLVFTTKHHDGFNMYDTKLSDYRITAPDCPYHANRHADVTAALFHAFRAKGFGIGVYYSKADWNSPYFWLPDRPARNRHPNYDPTEHPEIWQKFVAFVHGQIRELLTGYGPIEILWLDAGWVRPPKQDLDMDRLVRMARQLLPGLIVADRTVGGPHENYRTPEQTVPAEPLDQPWETCMTMGRQWSYNPNDEYKSTRELIHLLIDVVAKGGNLLLNVGPAPEGRLPEEAVGRLRDIGLWLRVNGEAIYGTRVRAPYRQDRWALTQRGDTVFAFYLLEDGEETLPAHLAVSSVRARANSQVYLLGVKEPLNWRQEGGRLVIAIPPHVAAAVPSRYACTLRIRCESSREG